MPCWASWRLERSWWGSPPRRSGTTRRQWQRCSRCGLLCCPGAVALPVVRPPARAVCPPARHLQRCLPAALSGLPAIKRGPHLSAQQEVVFQRTLPWMVRQRHLAPPEGFRILSDADLSRVGTKGSRGDFKEGEASLPPCLLWAGDRSLGGARAPPGAQRAACGAAALKQRCAPRPRILPLAAGEGGQHSRAQCSGRWSLPGAGCRPPSHRLLRGGAGQLGSRSPPVVLLAVQLWLQPSPILWDAEAAPAAPPCLPLPAARTRYGGGLHAGGHQLRIG